MKFDCLARPLAAAVAVLSCAALPASAQTPTRAPATSPPPAVATVPGMPPVPNAANLYSETAADKMNPAVAGDLPRVYVPHIQSNDVYVIDPATFQVIEQVQGGPQPAARGAVVGPAHAVGREQRGEHDQGQRDARRSEDRQGRASRSPVDDPYNMYFSPDGKSAIVVAEAMKRLDFRDPKTMAMQYSIDVPKCAGINHADFSIDGRYAIFTCEFSGTVAKIDLVERKVLGYTQVIQPGRPTKVVKGPDGRDETICTTWKGMPQDIRASPDGKRFYVADMMADGVHVVDLESFRQVGFIETGKGTHGLYPSRDGRKLYVANRGSNKIHGPVKGKGSVSVIDFATEKVDVTWPIPGGGSPDMGNVSADGKWLWLSGRYDNVVYVFDTATGAVKTIPVGKEPHGLTVWPQPGRYSLGHTGNLR